jgi:hypothetical protein
MQTTLAAADTFPFACNPIQPQPASGASSRAPCPYASTSQGGASGDAEAGFSAVHPLNTDRSQFDAGFTITASTSVRPLGDAVRESGERDGAPGALADDAYHFRQSRKVTK